MSVLIVPSLVVQIIKSSLHYLIILKEYSLQVIIPLLKWFLLVSWLTIQILLVPFYFVWVIFYVPLKIFYGGLKLLLVTTALIIVLPLMTFDLMLQYYRGASIREHR
ncbi:unnamed protein product [Phyllotreta striolata]|uniref:Uncharacterized protein n=1 Tax=Phyllotreta striolata TaxID=444603 RepID=A0A9N9TML1_PHYSR|nr:unnamed protein product [Phyllotreta striolata]